MKLKLNTRQATICTTRPMNSNFNFFSLDNNLHYLHLLSTYSIHHSQETYSPNSHYNSTTYSVKCLPRLHKIFASPKSMLSGFCRLNPSEYKSQCIATHNITLRSNGSNDYISFLSINKPTIFLQ